jgi:hypothetical protein
MQELLIKFQEAAFQMNPQSLWIPGCIGIVLGLFLWLGGTRYSSFVIGILGAGFGASCGILISHWFETPRMLSVIIAAAVVAIVAVILQRMVIAVLAMAIFAVTCGSTYMGFQISDINWQKVNETKNSAMNYVNPEPVDNSGSSSLLPAPLVGDRTGDAESTRGEETEGGNKTFNEIKNVLKNTVSNNTFMLALWVVLGALIGLTLAFLLKKVIMAICCSTVGTTGILLGVIAVFLAKQTPVVDAIVDRPKLAPTVFGVMVVLGLISQLLFAKKPKPETEDKDE